MAVSRIALGLLAFIQLAKAATPFVPIKEYSGSTFFNDWTFYNNYDNLTSGDVTFPDEATSFADGLVSVNPAGNAILKVDNTTNVAWNYKRNSVRITSNDTFGVGSVILFDAVHLPYGCSVWPSFWTHAAVWPDGGEIDIVEGVNMVTTNQMALHTDAGCTQADVSGAQTGLTLQSNCNNTDNSGCTVQETKPGSYGADFASNGGGVWATQIDVSGVYIWFWPRSQVPSSISGSTSGSSLDITTFGTPSGAWPASSCDVPQFFQPQYLVLDITLCGIWGNSSYTETCHTPQNSCYLDNVVGPGSPTYDNAYFEIPYIRVYTVSGAATPTSTGKTSSTGTSGSSGSGGSSPNAAPSLIDASALYSVFLMVGISMVFGYLTL